MVNKTNVLEFLEQITQQDPDRIILTDGQKEYSRGTLMDLSRRVGSGLLGVCKRRTPVIIYMEKNVDTVSAFFGTVYAGAFYTFLDPDLHAHRQRQIQDSLQSVTVITSSEYLARAKEQFPECRIFDLADLQKTEVDADGLSAVRRRHLDTDPLFIHFTSGSTGSPKGVLACHRNVIDFAGAFTDAFGICENDVLANQAPFDFDANVKDLYSAILTGAKMVLISKQLFSNPVPLLDYLCDQKVTIMTWAVSALCLLNAFNALEYKVPDTVRKVLFSGEVMPMKHLQDWMAHLPNAEFVNLYGPTEGTCNCTWHLIDRGRDYSDGIPVGRPFTNEEAFLLDEEDREITEPGKKGQICVRGTSVTLGYWNHPEETKTRFRNDPRTPEYPMVMYCTGDFGKYNEQGELLFCGRMDDQIKHSGHRIELSEIEIAMNNAPGVERGCCLFDAEKDRIHGFYCGEPGIKELAASLRKMLPVYMVPGVLHKLDSMPVTSRGKIDRGLLRKSLS